MTKPLEPKSSSVATKLKMGVGTARFSDRVRVTRSDWKTGILSLTSYTRIVTYTMQKTMQGYLKQLLKQGNGYANGGHFFLLHNLHRVKVELHMCGLFCGSLVATQALNHAGSARDRASPPLHNLEPGYRG